MQMNRPWQSPLTQPETQRPSQQHCVVAAAWMQQAARRLLPSLTPLTPLTSLLSRRCLVPRHSRPPAATLIPSIWTIIVRARSMSTAATATTSSGAAPTATATEEARRFLDYINASPSPFHAVGTSTPPTISGSHSLIHSLRTTSSAGSESAGARGLQAPERARRVVEPRAQWLVLHHPQPLVAHLVRCRWPIRMYHTYLSIYLIKQERDERSRHRSRRCSMVSLTSASWLDISMARCLGMAST